MADSVVRLRIDSKEYDANIKKAGAALADYFKTVREGGGTLEYLDEGVLDAVQAMGRLGTQSQTTRGSLRELTNAFTELHVQYTQLTDAEKNSDLGKSLSASLGELKQRIGATKDALNEAGKELGNTSTSASSTSGVLDTLAGKFGMSAGQLVGFGTAVAATKAGLEVAKDAFFASEESVDEWGRVMESSKSLYDGFLTALNTGDISGYLGRIGQIVAAARQAYNELDRLGTMKTIQGPAVSAQQTENERLQLMLRTGHYIAPRDGRRSTMQEGQLLTPEQLRRLEDQLRGGTQRLVSLIGNEVKQTTRAIDAQYKNMATKLGMSDSEFRSGTSSMEEFDKRLAGYAKYQEWNRKHSVTVSSPTVGGAMTTVTQKGNNPYEQYKAWGVFRVDGQENNGLVDLIRQRDQQMAQVYQRQGEAYRTINRAEGISVRKIMGGGSGGGSGAHTDQQRAAESVAHAEAKYADTLDLAAKQMEAGVTTEADYKKTLLSGQQRLYDAYASAYQTYADPSYKEAQAKAADEIVRLGGEVKAATETQRAAEKAAREQEQAQAKLAAAQNELAAAIASDDLKGQYAALKRLIAAGGQGSVAQTAGYTSANLDAFVASLKERISQSDVGSDLYTALTKQLADANALGNLIGEAVKRGIDVAEFAPEEIWKRIFGENPGDYISDEVWQGIIDRFSEYAKAQGTSGIRMDTATGATSEQKDEGDKTLAMMQKVTGGLSSVTSGLQAMGLKLPEGMTKLLGGIQGLMTVIQGVQSIIGLFSSTTASAQIASTAANNTMLASLNAQLPMLIAAIEANTFMPSFFSAGGVVHAAGGLMVPGTSQSGDLVPAMINSGELILNRAQQGVIADALEGGVGGGASAVPYVSGELLFLGLNNYLRRAGRGEIVTAKR